MSPNSAIAKPRISKPTFTFATEAGAKHRELFFEILIDTQPSIQAFPSLSANRSISANTPADVTSVPAPGP